MSVAKVLKMIKDKEVKFVDLRFTDTKEVATYCSNSLNNK